MAEEEGERPENSRIRSESHFETFLRVTSAFAFWGWGGVRGGTDFISSSSSRFVPPPLHPSQPLFFLFKSSSFLPPPSSPPFPSPCTCRSARLLLPLLCKTHFCLKDSGVFVVDGRATKIKALRPPPPKSSSDARRRENSAKTRSTINSVVI